MQKPSLGWQSWSPSTPNFWRLPSRDYCPVTQQERKILAPIYPKPLTYWCSWYALGYWPAPREIVHQAQLIKDYGLPITHILVDDGWRESWLPPVVSKLKQLGFKVGIWLAPYTRHKHLNTNAVLKHLLGDLGIDLLKLDFLYQPYFVPGLRDDSTPHNTLADLYAYISKQYPQVTTIACGAPFAPSIGRVDIIRLSKDTALPYPAPALLNRHFYASRMKLLARKYQIWSQTKHFTPDPDVRMFSLDTSATDKLWDTMPYQVKGIGDNLAKLNKAQIQEAHLWLTN